MNKYPIIYLLTLLFLAYNSINAQPFKVDDIIEVSGVIVTENEFGQPTPIPFATIAVKDKQKGTYANYNGMFTMVIKKGETLNFSAVGFSQYSINIPKDHKGLHHSVVVKLDPRDIQVDEVVIFPWPDRNNFRAEFLAMEPTLAGHMEKLAKENLDRKSMMEIRDAMSMDASENAAMYLRQQASSYSYKGQQQPMPILNPLAWAQFFKQINKKKEDKKKNKWDLEDR